MLVIKCYIEYQLEAFRKKSKCFLDISPRGHIMLIIYNLARWSQSQTASRNFQKVINTLYVSKPTPPKTSSRVRG